MDFPPQDEQGPSDRSGERLPESKERKQARIVRGLSGAAARLRAVFGISDEARQATHRQELEAETQRAKEYAYGLNAQFFTLLDNLKTVPQDPTQPHASLDQLRYGVTVLGGDGHGERSAQWTFGVSAAALVDETVRPYYTPLAGEGFGNLSLDHRMRRKRVNIPVRDMFIVIRFGKDITSGELCVTSSLSINRNSHPSTDAPAGSNRFDANIEIGPNGELVRIVVGDHKDEQGPHTISLMALSTNFEDILATINHSIESTNQAFTGIDELE